MMPNQDFPYSKDDVFFVPSPALEQALQSDPIDDVLYTSATYDQAIPTQVRPGSGPAPILSNNPVSANLVLFKELTGYPNYGNPSRNADILYTGNRGRWTFQSPLSALLAGNMRAELIIRAVLDDHANVPVNRYSLRITVNGTVVHNGRVQLPHGSPAGGMFNNWVNLTFNVPRTQRIPEVVIENTSNTGPDDWIAFDWMQLRFLPR